MKVMTSGFQVNKGRISGRLLEGGNVDSYLVGSEVTVLKRVGVLCRSEIGLPTNGGQEEGGTGWTCYCKPKGASV